MRTLAILAISLLLQGVQDSEAASIGLFADDNCSTCKMSLQQGSTATLYVRLTDLSGLPNNAVGLTSANFRITGLPPGWMTAVSPNPAVQAMIGNVFSAGGVYLFFGASQPGTCVDLLTIAVTATTPAEEVNLQVTGTEPPPHPDRTCPVVRFECDPEPCPFTPPYCVGGGALFINSSRDCSVAAVQEVWSKVKQLYMK